MGLASVWGWLEAVIPRAPGPPPERVVGWGGFGGANYLLRIWLEPKGIYMLPNKIGV